MKITDISDERIQEFIEILAGVSAKEIKRNIDEDSIECEFTTGIVYDDNEEIPVTETVVFDKYTLRNSQRSVTANDIVLHHKWLVANWCHPWFENHPLFEDNPFLN